MSTTVISQADLRQRSAVDRAPLLRWMIFTGATIFGVSLLWHFGLVKLMIASDRTYISSVISVLYVAASLHCLWRTIVVSREAEASRRIERGFAEGSLVMADVASSNALPPGLIADHIRNLQLKAQTQGAGRLDQTLLLRGLADKLRGSNGLGAFAGDTGHRQATPACPKGAKKRLPHSKKGAETQQTTRPPTEAASFLAGQIETIIGIGLQLCNHSRSRISRP
jgi:hypothetical protein